MLVARQIVATEATKYTSITCNVYNVNKRGVLNILHIKMTWLNIKMIFIAAWFDWFDF